jgi:hypothetical protein
MLKNAEPHFGAVGLVRQARASHVTRLQHSIRRTKRMTLVGLHPRLAVAGLMGQASASHIIRPLTIDTIAAHDITHPEHRLLLSR